MKEDGLKGRVLTMASTFLILLLAVVTIAMQIITGYYLYYFLAMTGLFLGATNLLFILLELEEVRNNAPKKEKKPKRKVKRARRKKHVADEEEETEEVLEQEEPVAFKEKKAKINWHLVINTACFAVYVVIFYFTVKGTFSYANTMKDNGNPAVVNGVFLLILFVVCVAFDRICKYAHDEMPFVDAIMENGQLFFKLLSLQSLLGAVCVLIESLNLFAIKKYVTYIYIALFFYYVVFITISLAVIAIRKDFTVAPYLNIPLPFVKKTEENGRLGFIEYLEKNTGISMRSLVSVKYIKQILPVVVLISGIALWLSTCIVQVETYQKAAVYRIGDLQEEFLEPGIHFVLPYPFDKVEIYDTETINKITIGYRSEESTDNIWTASHGEEEYKLLLGGGDELVSINIRLEYKIDDLKKYLTKATKPESILQALAYELVTDETIATDLSSLLSVDRDEFAETLKKQLTGMIKKQDIGLEVVSVVLESIHPPVEIAAVYQELISAEILAQKHIASAQGNANKTIAEAEKQYITVMGLATQDNYEQIATAKSTIAEFMASVEAYKSNPDAYKFQKYLAAVRKAYGNANLVIVGEGIDQSAIIFGNISGSSTGNNSGGTTTK